MFLWRDGRVAEGGGLLSRCSGKTATEGSNPSLSANLKKRLLARQQPLFQIHTVKEFQKLVNPNLVIFGL